MKDRAYHFEIRDLITQFVAAFDDVVIGRYNKTRDELSQIKVRYVYSPKERVLFDLVNKAQNLTLPVIAVSLNGISRDESRVFNKLYGFDVVGRRSNNDILPTTNHVNMPVPVNIGVSMSIVTNYQTDLDQILSNFIPYNNPYVILSWKVPEAFNLPFAQEIRSEVLWDGSVSLKYPTETTGSDKFRIEADTTFTIKGWLFPAAPTEPLKNIFFIDSNFYTTRIIDNKRFQGYETKYLNHNSAVVDSLTSYTQGEMETTSISAVPQITNVYFTDTDIYALAYDTVLLHPRNIGGNFLIQGKQFQYTNNILISSSNPSFYNALSSFDFEYYPSLSAHVLPTSSYQIINENIINLKLPLPLNSGQFNIITQGVVGWDSTHNHNVHLAYNM